MVTGPFSRSEIKYYTVDLQLLCQSRGCGIIENTFGIVTSRWGIFLTSIQADIKNAEIFVLSCIALHNYLMQTNCSKYSTSGFVNHENKTWSIKPGEWRSSVVRENSNGCFGSIKLLKSWRCERQ